MSIRIDHAGVASATTIIAIGCAVWSGVAAADPVPGPLATTPVCGESKLVRLNGSPRFQIRATLRGNKLTAILQAVTEDGPRRLARRSVKEEPRRAGEGEYPANRISISKHRRTAPRGGTARLLIIGPTDPPEGGRHRRSAQWERHWKVTWRVGSHPSIRLRPASPV